MLMSVAKPNTRPSIIRRCPSCGHTAAFTDAGEQHWPRRVAEILGMPMVMPLWHCEHCHTTVSDVELDK